MSRSHNKKRNVGLVYEFLVRYISKALVEGRSDSAQRAVAILNRRFKPGTQLYKEFRLFNSLLVTHVSSANVVNTIITEARQATRRLNVRSLDNEKSALIREINHSLQDPNFFNQKISDYRAYATIQTLLNDWRSGDDIDIAKMATLEDNLTEWIMTERVATEDIQSQKSSDVNDVVVSIMSEKISKKYQGVLSDEQQALIKEYVISAGSDSPVLAEMMLSIRAETSAVIKSYISENTDSFINQKLGQALELISSDNITEVSDRNIGHHLGFLKLIEEIRS